jgi:hypothetical protein
VPAFAGPLLGFALGAWLARWGRAAGGMVPALAFGAIVFGPVCAYPLIFYPDWAFAYLFDSRSVPSALLLLLVLIDAAVPALGFWLARRALAREAMGDDPAAHAVALALVMVPGGFALMLLAALSPRLATEGSFAMVRGDFGTAPLWRSPLGYALVWLGGCTAAGFWATGRALATVSVEPEAHGHQKKRALGTPAARAGVEGSAESETEASALRSRLGTRRKR